MFQIWNEKRLNVLAQLKREFIYSIPLGVSSVFFEMVKKNSSVWQEYGKSMARVWQEYG